MAKVVLQQKDRKAKIKAGELFEKKGEVYIIACTATHGSYYLINMRTGGRYTGAQDVAEVERTIVEKGFNHIYNATIFVKEGE